jgi:hypothetical protein
MFFKYLQPLLAPFQKIRQKKVEVQSQVGKVKVDVGRVKGLGNQAKNIGGQVQAAGAKVGGVMQPGAPGAPAPKTNPNPPIRTSGFLFWKKKHCTQCDNELDKTWPTCPYCKEQADAEAAAAAALANAPKPKTAAFVINPSGGGGGGIQLLGWLVPLQGSQRGELFTLTPHSTIGTDPTCTVVLHDKFMSSKHAEIKAEGGVWVLKDLGSTNGTYVNDKRVDKHELVDNDFVKFGGSLVKFKSL